jgi:hypothetical protein
MIVRNKDAAERVVVVFDKVNDLLISMTGIDDNGDPLSTFGIGSQHITVVGTRNA